ncbi:MAG: hypothetical protein AAF412_14260 [Pseudomonadota bacterium]
MPTLSKHDPGHDNPALLCHDVANAQLMQSFREAMENTDNDRDFLKSIVKVIQSEGCKLLFEIPGSLFNEPKYQAAAVLHLSAGKQPETVFVLCNRKNAAIQILNESDVEPQVLVFVDSYANVLASLNALESCKSLH